MGILKTIEKNDILKIALVVIAIYFFMKFFAFEKLENVVSDAKVVVQPSQPPVVQPPSPQVVQPVVVPEVKAPVVTKAEQQSQIDKVVGCQTPLCSTDLLPQYDDANAFAKQNPVSKLLQEQNFLQAGYHAGINTIVQSNKLPYLDIRSCPPIPKQEVGPFNNSSYEQPAGANRRFLEIGS
jgi:hypothetical protein